MKRLFRKILIGLTLLTLPILGYTQGHDLDAPDEGKASLGVSNLKYLNTGSRESMDSIFVYPSSMTGDSLPMLYGSRKAAITWVAVDYYPVSTAYTTTGSTDTMFVYVKTTLGNKKVCGFEDGIFDETISATPTSGHVNTPGGMIDSCLYWLAIPSSKYSGGDGYWKLRYKWITD